MPIARRAKTRLLFSETAGAVHDRYSPDAQVTLFTGDRLDLLQQIPSASARLIVTSPPYNVGKEYEQREALDAYLKGQEQTLRECVRVLASNGSLCWQVGNYVSDGE